MLITLARKPLVGSVAQNVLAHGCGALNIDDCRIGSEGGTRRDGKATMPNDAGWENMRGHKIASLAKGRWPANMLHDGSDAVLTGFPQAVGNHGGRIATSKFQFGAGNGAKISATNAKHDSGSAARFFKQVRGC